MGVAQVFKLVREIRRKGGCYTETVYGLTSLDAAAAGPARLLACVRAHWQSENRLHWRRDVTLGEDRCQVRAGQAPQVLASLNNFVLGMLDRLQVKNVGTQQRHFAAKPMIALQLLLAHL